MVTGDTIAEQWLSSPPPPTLPPQTPPISRVYVDKVIISFRENNTFNQWNYIVWMCGSLAFFLSLMKFWQLNHIYKMCRKREWPGTGHSFICTHNTLAHTHSKEFNCLLNCYVLWSELLSLFNWGWPFHVEFFFLAFYWFFSSFLNILALTHTNTHSLHSQRTAEWFGLLLLRLYFKDYNYEIRVEL